jgi:hypothetical protein
MDTQKTNRMQMLAVTAIAVSLFFPQRLRAFTPPGPNIARGKTYTLTPRPNYRHCTDPDDARQLTDGVYSTGYFWVQKTTVGWNHAMPVYITVDLGKVEPIAGASFNSAAGTAGVSWPQNVFVMVSDDAETWRFVGDLVALALKDSVPASDVYSVHRFAAATVKTRGRYVQFIVAQDPYCFVDEVEVYRGKDAWLKEEPGGEVLTDTRRFFAEAKIIAAVSWRLNSDLNGILERLRKAGLPPAERARLEARAAKLAARVRTKNFPEALAPTFRTVLPLNAVHADIFALNAPVLRAAGVRNLVAWSANRWDPLSIIAMPPKDASPPRLEVAMMRGEVRAAALNLTNPADSPVEVTVLVRGLPGGENPGYVRIKDVLFTDTGVRTPVAAALPEAQRHVDGPFVTIPAGCTKQIWLSFYRPDDLPAGTHDGELLLRYAGAGGAKTVSVPLRFTLFDLRFPARPTLSVGGWDYTNSAAYYRAPGNIKATLALLRDHYVDTPWATGAVRPRGGEYGPDGTLKNPDKLDFSAWDTWVKRWHDARNYYVFLNVGEDFHGEKMGTARFDRMVGEWITAWVKHLEGQKLAPHQLGLLLVDEPHSEAQDRRILAWARALKRSQPDVVIWEDPTWRDPRKGVPEMFSACTVLCPNTPMMLAQGKPFVDFYRAQQKNGRVLWLYSCSGPAKLLDPYAYHRGQKWRAIELGAVGSGYWAFGCGGGIGNSWNAYAQTHTEYSPYFVGRRSVTDGKHMEAIREGVQDYEYFVMLRKRVRKLDRRGDNRPALARARKFLKEGPRQVNEMITANKLSWAAKKDRSVMDRVRVQALRLLAELAK